MFQYGIRFNAANQKKILQNKRKVSESIIDETPLKVGNQYIWLWIAIEPADSCY
jgi:transposase-like protein